MLDSMKVGNFIMEKRKALGLTQQQLADKLNISFQAVSKWENGTTYPNIEILRDLAIVLEVSVDEILAGSERDVEGLSYSKAGIDITYTDTIKKEMAKHLETRDRRVLNGLGPFASLYDIKFPNIENPVLVLKSEEPGSKQKFAKGAFTCFLVHGAFMGRLFIENVVNENIFILLVHQFGVAAVLYLVSYVVYKIYYICSHWFIKLITPICDKIDVSVTE